MSIAREIVVVLSNVRSTYNVGAIMRTLDAVGGSEVICCGITPYPEIPGDTRSPVVQTANTKAIAKTALGAERELAVSYHDDVSKAIGSLRSRSLAIYALERAPGAVNIFEFEPAAGSFAVVLGDEVAGIAVETRDLCDAVLEIPQYGKKESLNVSVAGGIALYQLRLGSQATSDSSII